MKKIILISIFFGFLICNLAVAKIITLNNCYVVDGWITLAPAPTSLKEVKEKYDKDEYIIDTERKTITHNSVVKENKLSKGDDKIYVDVFNLEYFDSKFAKGSRKEKVDHIKSHEITLNLTEKTFKQKVITIDVIGKEHELSWDYKCGGSDTTDILKKIIGK